MLPTLDKRLRTALVSVSSAGVVLALLALLLFGARAALSVATGAALATANLWGLALIVGALLPREESSAQRQARAAWALVAALKMAALFVVVWVLLEHKVVSPLAMLVGFSALPIGVAIGSLVSDRNASA